MRVPAQHPRLLFYDKPARKAGGVRYDKPACKAGGVRFLWVYRNKTEGGAKWLSINWS